MTTFRLGIGSNVRLAKLSAAAAEPVWNVIMPAGEWHRADWGVMKCDRPFFEAMISNWKKVGAPELPIDRFHWGSSNETSVTDPRAKAAVGWIQDLRISASGDLEALCAWNPDGKADIEGKRFQYFSPEWHENAVDKATGKRQGPTLKGGSLLNDPYFIGHLPKLAATDAPDKEQFMTREELIELYGLKSDATDADIRAASKKGAEASRAAADEVQKRTAAESRKTELETELRAAKERDEANEKRIAALEAETKKAKEDAKAAADKAAADALCAKLESEGRIVAAEKADVLEDVKTYGLAKATERYGKRAQVVPLSERGHNRGGGDGELAPKEAHRQLEAKAAEIRAKGGPDAERAYLLACEQNPQLAERAHEVSALVAKEDAEKRTRV